MKQSKIFINGLMAMVCCLSATHAGAVVVDANTVSTVTPDGRTVTVRAHAPRVIAVENFHGTSAPASTQAVGLDAQPAGATITRTPSTATITTLAGFSATLDLKSGAVSFADRTPDGRTRTLVTDSGTRPEGTITLTAPAGGSYYGTGERGHSLRLNGDTLVMYNRQNYGYQAGEDRINQMNITMPLFLSDEGYGVMFDDHAPAALTLGAPIVYTTENRQPVTYYVVDGGANLADATREMSLLTGRQALPPFWSLGYITSKYGYKSQRETEQVVDTLRRAGFPLDGVVLDLYWFGKETDMGRLSWATDSFPDPRGMLSRLKARGVNTVLISEPYINKIGAIDNYNLLDSLGMLTLDSLGRSHDVTTWVGAAGMFDVSNPATRQWLSQRYAELTDDGVGGWWGDLGEPEVHPETIRHRNGMTAREYHNVYGNVWSRIIYDLFRDRYPDRRLMTLMRGGTTGLQRYSVFPWSTDVSRSWGGLRPQVRIMLNSSLSGLGYMSHDVGGFAITDTTRVTDPELYVRWVQLGTFSPILRTHAQQEAEPFRYPQHQTTLLNLVRERYRWLPYNYTLAYENATQGTPLVRPLNYYDPAAPDTIDDEYLWGRDVLVAPVLTQGATERAVTFPAGSWVNYHHPWAAAVSGPTTINVSAPLDEMPIYVRAGSFIPQAHYEMASTQDYDPSRLTVLYYPRANGKSTYTLYDDDRTSPSSIADGQYALVNFTGRVAGNVITIEVQRRGAYVGMPRVTQLNFVLPGIKASDITSARTADGRRLRITATPEGYASIRAALVGQKPLTIGLVKK